MCRMSCTTHTFSDYEWEKAVTVTDSLTLMLLVANMARSLYLVHKLTSNLTLTMVKLLLAGALKDTEVFENHLKPVMLVFIG